MRDHEREERRSNTSIIVTFLQNPVFFFLHGYVAYGLLDAHLLSIVAYIYFLRMIFIYITYNILIHIVSYLSSVF